MGAVPIDNNINKAWIKTPFLFVGPTILKKRRDTASLLTERIWPVADTEGAPYSTNICFDGFLWSSPFTCSGSQTKWKAHGRFPFVWLHRRSRPSGIQYK